VAPKAIAAIRMRVRRGKARGGKRKRELAYDMP
jgi:hypothetical protein